MKKKVFAPLREEIRDWQDIEDRIIALFRKEIYLPILKELELHSDALKGIKNGLYNALNDTDALVKAVSSGRLRYDKGRFKGSFSAALSRELSRLGAKWDRTERVWKIPLSKLSPELKAAVDSADQKFQELLKRVEAKIAALRPEEIADKLKIEHKVDDTIFRANKKFEDKVRSITVAPQLSKQARAKIARDYSENMKLYIKDFANEHLADLRAKVQKSAYAGERHEAITKIIQQSYGVSESKAKFLARQETSILMANFQEARFRDVGSQEYVWKCVPNGPHGPHPVRHLHWVHHDETFRWDAPPVVDKAGNRKNPGIDYNCRCTALPVLNFGKE